MARKPHLKDSEKAAIAASLLGAQAEGKSKRKVELARAVAAHHDVSQTTVLRIWRTILAAQRQGEPLPFAGTIVPTAMDPANKKVRARPSEPRDVPKVHAQRPTHLKPMAVTTKHRLDRIEHCTKLFNSTTMTSVSLLEAVHIDEKWFLLDLDRRSAYATSENAVIPGDDGAVGQNGRILKVMFLAAVARPRPHRNGKGRFDGKIGMWPFVISASAESDLNSEQADAVEIKAERVDRQVYLKMLTENVIPAIKQKWPLISSSRRVVIHQNHAAAHISPTDPGFLEHAQSNSWDISMYSQPTRSPDLNVLNLGIFSAIHKIYLGYEMASMEEIVSAADSAFEELPPETIANAYARLFACAVEVLRLGGENDYWLPRPSKREGEEISESVSCPKEVYTAAISLHFKLLSEYVHEQYIEMLKHLAMREKALVEEQEEMEKNLAELLEAVGSSSSRRQEVLKTAEEMAAKLEEKLGSTLQENSETRQKWTASVQEDLKAIQEAERANVRLERAKLRVSSL